MSGLVARRRGQGKAVRLSRITTARTRSGRGAGRQISQSPPVLRIATASTAALLVTPAAVTAMSAVMIGSASVPGGDPGPGGEG
jgi:hypothetical protein